MRHAVPWASAGLSVAGAIGVGALSLAAGIVSHSFLVGLLLLLGVSLVLLLVGSYGAWRDADIRAYAYELDTPLKRGIAASLRDARELRGRLRGATHHGVYDVAVEIWCWSGQDIHQWLDDDMGADELAAEWKALMPGIDASTPEEFEAALGRSTVSG